MPIGTALSQVSAGAGATIPFAIDAGETHAGHTYWVFGSVVDEGFDGGVRVGELELPLRDDDFFRRTFARPDGDGLTKLRGVLDAEGRASAPVSVELPAGSLEGHVGRRVRHVIAIFDGTDLAYQSPPLDVTIVE